MAGPALTQEYKLSEEHYRSNRRYAILTALIGRLGKIWTPGRKPMQPIQQQAILWLDSLVIKVHREVWLTPDERDELSKLVDLATRKASLHFNDTDQRIMGIRKSALTGSEVLQALRLSAGHVPLDMQAPIAAAKQLSMFNPEGKIGWLRRGSEKRQVPVWKLGEMAAMSCPLTEEEKQHIRRGGPEKLKYNYGPFTLENPIQVHRCPLCSNPVPIAFNTVATGCDGCGAILGLR